MIISPGRRFIFVHVPKTGGTALTLALEDRAMKDDILIGDTPKARRRRNRLKRLTARGRLWKHSTLADIDGVLADGVLDDMLVVTLVRNPWDRMVSYYHWLQAQTFDHPAVGLSRTLSFADFLYHPMIVQSFRAAPYDSYVARADGGPVKRLFLRLENLDSDIAPFEAHLGFAICPLAPVNRSDRHADYRSYYDEDLQRHVAAVCAADIARFGYRF
ncbi:sulfotransferase family 2 domain-containing protein [Oceaniglobus indicus]|uniref:sulfotransferase family 2 domain-containing protein n=1 Tax=Oceaniglobus indicus TaxID=2047749 RepID=UPI000C18FCF6|nr:sulfotransferase family 2 domain-containing protein [Oceaniglobus indicus]